jgi:KTSC domain
MFSRLTAAVPVKEATVIRRIALVSCFFIVISGDAWGEPSPAPNHITSRIPRQPVQSTAIAKVGYSKRHHILEIEFVNGAVYRYFDVSLSAYRDLMSAESKARFYDSKIRKHYRSVLVRQRQKEQPTGRQPITQKDLSH